MSVLFNLPDELCKTVIEGMLDLMCLVYLDASLCCKSYRAVYLKCLANSPCKIRLTTIEQYRWCFERNMTPKEVVFSREMDGFELNYLDRKDHVSRVIILGNYDLNIILDGFSSVKSLICRGTMGNWTESMLSKLNTLDIGNFAYRSNLVHIRDHCRSLTDFRCNTREYDLVSGIILSNPLLRHLEIAANRMLLQLIGTNCPNLVELFVSNGFDFRAFALIINQCPYLDILSVVAGSRLAYNKEKEFLFEIDSDFNGDVTGWSEFIGTIKGVTKIEIVDYRSLFPHLVVNSIFDGNEDSLTELSLRCDQLTLENMQYMLTTCRKLEIISLYVDMDVCWDTILASNPPLKSVELLKGPKCKDIVQIHNQCPLLNNFSAEGVYFDLCGIHDIIQAVECHPNKENMTSYIEFKSPLNGRWEFEWRYSDFHGNAYEQYEAFMKKLDSERWMGAETQRYVKSLEDKLARYERQPH